MEAPPPNVLHYYLSEEEPEKNVPVCANRKVYVYNLALYYLLAVSINHQQNYEIILNTMHRGLYNIRISLFHPGFYLSPGMRIEQTTTPHCIVHFPET